MSNNVSCEWRNARAQSTFICVLLLLLFYLSHRPSKYAESLWRSYRNVNLVYFSPMIFIFFLANNSTVTVVADCCIKLSRFPWAPWFPIRLFYVTPLFFFHHSTLSTRSRHLQLTPAPPAPSLHLSPSPQPPCFLLPLLLSLRTQPRSSPPSLFSNHSLSKPLST